MSTHKIKFEDLEKYEASSVLGMVSGNDEHKELLAVVKPSIDGMAQGYYEVFKNYKKVLKTTNLRKAINKYNSL